MSDNINLSQLELIDGFKIILGDDSDVISVEKNSNHLIMKTRDCIIKIYQMTNWIYFESKHLTIVINVTDFKIMLEHNSFCNILSHFVKYWETWSNIFKNTGYLPLGEFKLIYKKINDQQYNFQTSLVSFEIGSKFNISWSNTNQICIEKKNIKCFFPFNHDNLDFITKNVKKIINKVTTNTLKKILPIESVRSTCFLDRAKNDSEIFLSDNFIDITMAINYDYYINFVVIFDKTCVDDNIKISDVQVFLDFEDGIVKLTEIMKLADLVINLDDETLENSPAYFTDLYRKIKEDTLMLNKEFERENRSVDLFLKQSTLLVQQDLDPNQPNLDDLIQSEDYTQTFLKQICCIECLKDPTLIQYIEPTSKVDANIQKYVLATINKKSKKFLEFSDIIQILKALIIS